MSAVSRSGYDSLSHQHGTSESMRVPIFRPQGPVCDEKDREGEEATIDASRKFVAAATQFIAAPLGSKPG
jgi:hypothetical protein